MNNNKLQAEHVVSMVRSSPDCKATCISFIIICNPEQGLLVFYYFLCYMSCVLSVLYMVHYCIIPLAHKVQQQRLSVHLFIPVM